MFRLARCRTLQLSYLLLFNLLKWLNSPHFGYIFIIKMCITQNERKENPMPVSAKQLNFCNISNNLILSIIKIKIIYFLYLMNLLILVILSLFLFTKNIIQSLVLKETFHLNLCLMLLLLKIFYLFLLLIF